MQATTPALLALAGIFLAASTARARDPWPMFRGDAQRTGRASFEGPSRGRVAWKTPLGAPVRSSPAVTAAGQVFVGTDGGALVMLDAKTGAVLTRARLGGRIWAGPLVHSGRVFVGSDDQFFYALEHKGQTLSLAWKVKTGDFIYGAAAPLGADVVFGSWDGGLYRLAQADGARRWRYGKRGDMESSPAVSRDGAFVYGGSRDRKLHAVRAESGPKHWKFGTADSVNSTPAIGPGGTIYVGSDDNYLYAITSRGKRRWRFRARADVVSSPALSPDGRTVYVGSHDGHLYAVRTRNGRLRWKYKCDVVWSSPAVDAAGRIYFGAWDGAVHALDPAGKPLFVVKTGAPIWSSPALSPGRLYIGSNDGAVYAIE